MTQLEKDNAQSLKTIANAMVKIAKHLEKQNEVQEEVLEITRRQEERTMRMIGEMEDNTRG